MAYTYKYRYQELYKGVQIDVKSNTQSDLHTKVNRKKAKIDSSVIDSNILFKDWAIKWLETYKQESVSTSWYNDLTAIVNNKLLPELGNKKLTTIRPIEVQSLLNSYSTLSSSYVKQIYDVTNQILKKAYINGLTDSDLSLTLGLPPGRADTNGRSITDYERKHLLLAVDDHRGELFVKLILYTGLRPGEVAALQWADINLKNMTVNVNKALKKDGSIGSPKSKAGIRVVPIPAHMKTFLETKKGQPFTLVCPQLNGTHHTPTSRKKMWKSVQRSINISMGCRVFRNALIPPYPLADDFTMYNLRHTYCTDLEKMGVPINIASRLMGHSSISITSKIYTHASEEALDIARAMIDSQHLKGNTLGKTP